MMTPENSWYQEEAAMAQFDDNIGDVIKHLEDKGLADNTIVIITADNGAENFSWPDGGQTPFAGGKGQILEGGMRVPMIISWPAKVPAEKVSNGIMSGLDWFPTLVSAAGDPNIVAELKNGKELGDRSYKVHLDGYDQMNLITGKGPSNRHEVLYFAESTLGAIRIDDYKYRFIDQPNGWFGGTVKVDWPIITDLRLDPFERTGWPTGTNGAFPYPFEFFGHEFWRFTYVQKVVGEYAQTFIQFPPMQRGASFNMEEVKRQVQQAIQEQSRMGQ